MNHGGKHLRHDKKRNILCPAFPRDILLHARQLTERNIIAEVAAGDHDHIGCGDDLIEMRKAGAVFDLREDPDVFASVFRKLPAHFSDIIGAPNKWLHHRRDLHLFRKREIHAVGFGERGKVDVAADDLHAFARGERSAPHDEQVFSLHRKLELSVIEQNRVAVFEMICDLPGKRNR